MIKEYIFYSPPPEKLGQVTNADFDNVASVGQEIGSKYADPSIPAYILSSSSVAWEIDPDGKIGLATGIAYSDRYDTKYATSPLTPDESNTVSDVTKPFINAGKDWLHPDEAIVVDFFRQKQKVSYEGGWHFDGTPGSDDFRGAIFYDELPTEFAVGKIAINVPDEQYPPSPKQIDSLISAGRVVQELADKRSALTFIKGPEPLTGVGIANGHIHRVAAISPSDDGTIRSFLRLGTRIRKEK